MKAKTARKRRNEKKKRTQSAESVASATGDAKRILDNAEKRRRQGHA